MHELTTHVEHNGTTEVCVFKVTPQVQGVAHKTLVNLYSYDAEHFEDQCIHIKSLYYKYQPKRIAIDANGLIKLAHLKFFELLGSPNRVS